MKKHTFLIFIILISSFAKAQDKPKPDFGIKTGFNCASITKTPNGSIQVRYFIGGFAKFPLTHKTSLQPEIQYSAQGVDFIGGSYNTNYLLVPVLFKYYLGNAFHLEFGPQYGYLTSAKRNENGSNSTNVTNNFNRSDFSLDFGATYTFDYQYILGLRYNLGLTQLQKSVMPEEPPSKNSVLQISIGYKF